MTLESHDSWNLHFPGIASCDAGRLTVRGTDPLVLPLDAFRVHVENRFAIFCRSAHLAARFDFEIFLIVALTCVAT